jgi:hypothetical protein
MIQDVTSIISAVAVVVGLAFAGVQLRFLVLQLRDGQAASRAAELRAVNSMGTKLQYLIEEPELREHFYSNKAIPADDATRNKVLLISEAYADTLDLGVGAASDVQRCDAAESWSDYAQFVLQNAPGIRLLVAEHPKWWSELTKEFSSLPIRPDSGSLGGGPCGMPAS